MGWDNPLEKEMTTHSSILAWEILWTEESGRLQSMGSQRVGHHRMGKQQFCFQILFPCRLLHNVEQSSLCYMNTLLYLK